ncbi:MAG: hypothetical protein RL226_1068, partial [Bacteroidota bacterium]
AYQHTLYAHKPYTLYYHTGDAFWLISACLGFAMATWVASRKV